MLVLTQVVSRVWRWACPAAVGLRKSGS